MTLVLAGAVVVAALLIGLAAAPFIRWGQPFSPAKFGQFLAAAAGQLAAFAMLLAFIFVVFWLLHALNTAGTRKGAADSSHGGYRSTGWRWALGLPARRPRRAGAPDPAVASPVGSGRLALPASGPGRVGPWSRWPFLLPAEGLHAPSLRSLQVDPVVTAEGLPVTVSWDFADAEEVIVAGHRVRQGAGSLQVVPEGSGPLEVLARNGSGTRQEWTPAVTVLPVPRLHSLTLPAAPSVRLHVEVSAVLDARAPATVLQQLFARQDALEYTGSGPGQGRGQATGQVLTPPPAHVPAPQLSPLLVPAGLRRWWQSGTQHLHTALDQALRRRGTVTFGTTTELSPGATAPAAPAVSVTPEKGPARRD
ncbi:hypothetical protein [Kineococcus sp. SYSU DK002]|uniref:hypothetical protein n=1 Tax=Kineococcus sp. SYSU DK002 TaxID=3383123 RepID=UPI003D7DEB39